MLKTPKTAKFYQYFLQHNLRLLADVWCRHLVLQMNTKVCFSGYFENNLNNIGKNEGSFLFFKI